MANNGPTGNNGNMSGSASIAGNNWHIVPAASMGAKEYYTVNYPPYIENTGETSVTNDCCYEIEYKRASDSSFAKLKFFSEEEFVFSFKTLYTDLQENKRYTTTSNAIISLDSISFVRTLYYNNGLKMLLSPFYILERAKELNL